MKGNQLEEKRHWDEVFTQYDNYRQNFITVDTFKRLLHEGGLREELAPERIKHLLEFADRNQDGYLTRQEFIDFMMGNVTTDDDVEMTADVRQMRDKVRKRFRNRISNIAMREALVSDDRISTYTNVMSEKGYIPIFIPLISIAELAVFIYYCIDMGEVGPTGPVPIKSPLIFDPNKHEELWRFISYLLVHAGIEHIAANLLFQLLIGILLEIVHGPLRMIIIYFAGVIAGSLATAVIDSNVYLCGASAGVYALLAAYLANIVMNWSEMNWLFRLVRLVFLAVYATIDIGTALYRRYLADEESKTAYMAHVFGAIAGFLIGIVILRNIKKKLHEQVLFWIALCVYIIMDVLLLCIYIGMEFSNEKDK